MRTKGFRNGPQSTPSSCKAFQVLTKWTFVLDADLLPNAPAVVFQRQMVQWQTVEDHRMVQEDKVGGMVARGEPTCVGYRATFGGSRKG